MSAAQPKIRWLFAVASGVSLAALYAPLGWDWLGWVALAPLIHALRGASSRRAAALGWVCGTIGGLGVTGWWIGSAAIRYFALPLPLAAGFTVAAIAIFVSPAFALFGALGARLLQRRGAALTVPAAFVSCELLRAHLFGGNPWALLGQSQNNLALLQVCDLTGVYGVSFLLALCAYALASWRQSRRPLLATLGLVIAVIGYGEWRMAEVDAENGPALQVAVVQGNLDNLARGRPEHFAAHLEHYLMLTRSVATPAPDLIIWPEQAIGFFLEDNPQLTGAVRDALRGTHTLLLTGAPRSVSRDGAALLYNSAYLIGAEGLMQTYDKRVLLPFVERLPLRWQDGPYQAGASSGVLTMGDRSLGVLICYEAIYAGLARELRRGGAQWLVNLSNDSWFDAGGGPQQHLQAVRLRAIEQRMSVIRATNSGISAVISPTGRELLRLPADTATAVALRVTATRAAALYTWSGDLFAWTCVGLSLFGLFLKERRNR